MADETTLYRKYRPQAFDEVVGQEHIVQALKGAVENNSFSHAYLFSGSRGIGKTSIARIFAHAIGTSDNDIYEIDAASNRRIDDVRSLRDAVAALPLESPYKVYIIDEVHMLTKEAFNALLKTLEEPPAHALFILATTEIDKLPDTIVSRCQTFSFKRPNQKTLAQVVTDVAKSEGFELDDGAANLMAVLGEGSFRDAKGILQKVLGSGEKKKITVEDVEALTGAPRSELVNDVIRAVAYGDSAKGFAAIERVVSDNSDIRTFMKLVLQKMRYALLLRFAPDTETQIQGEVSEEDLATLKEIAGDKEAKLNSRTLDVLLEAFENMRHAYLPQLPLEIALIRLTGEEESS